MSAVASAVVPAVFPALAGDVLPVPDERFGGLGAVQVVALVLCTVVPLIGWALLFRQVGRFVALYRLGRPDTSRTDSPAARTWTLAKEFLGHTRMSRIKVVAVAHWFTALAFIILFSTLVNAFFQLVQPDYRLPLIGHFPPFEWVVELFAWTGLVGIVVLMLVRQREHPRSAAGEGGRRSRFFGSTFWQAYYVELTILLVTICILLLRGLESALVQRLEPETSLALHFPLTGWMAGLWSGSSVAGLATWVYVVATVKILISFAWMITIALQPTMGVAWHRFLAFPNIWFKRESSGRTALGTVRPLTVGGKPFTLDALEEMEEGDSLGVGAVEDFTWKGLLDFSTCTECGRCQSQCPAWNTDKPLSPKLLMMALRDHADAKAPYLTALAQHDGDDEKALATVAARQAAPDAVPGTDGAATAVDWSQMALVGNTGYDISSPLTAYNPHGPDAVIDADVLWSCTTCGACVEQCPVDIEHVDHIVDMRRYATLIESAFPAELGGLFKNLEGKGNPWGMGARARLDWAKDLPFPVKVLGQDVEKASDVEWLFWVGCAGAYEDRAKKTTRAVAELLDTAGVSFAVLGDGETCTGDSARRAGNELLFQTLAAQNVETFGEFGVTKVVVTCAHCFNTIKNEYPAIGGSYEVVHHTQLLNRLVREKKLVPVARPSDAPGMSTARNAASTASTVTYHDPCYLGRHNGVYAPPRELIGALPGVELREMPRSKEKSFCCGAGGARMWMEEKLGTRINTNRTEEAVATGAERIAIGCPFCRVMISDGLTAKQAAGEAEEVEVVDVAQMLLAAVRRSEEVESEEDAAPVAQPAVAEAAAPAAAAAVATTVEETTPAERPRDDIDQSGDVAPTTDDADPWDDTLAASAPAPAEQQVDPSGTEPDPWDQPAAVDDTTAGRSEGEPSAEKAKEDAAASTDDVDPWDEPADRTEIDQSVTPGTPGVVEDEPAPEAVAPEPAPVADDDVDPWDEPADRTEIDQSVTPGTPGVVEDEPAPEPAAVAAPAAPTSTDDVDPWDEPADRTEIDQSVTPGMPGVVEDEPAPEAVAPAPAAAADDDVDPWDEPADRTEIDQSVTASTPGVAEDEPAPEAVAPAPAAAADDDVDPWDEPADRTEIDQSVTASTPGVAEDEPAPEPVSVAAPAAPAADDDVDPWDEPADRTRRDLLVDSGTDVDPADEVASHEPEPAPQSASAEPAPQSASAEPESAPQSASADPEVAPEPASAEPEPQPESAPSASAPAGGFTGDPTLLDEPDPWD
ncbi:heterodisulfide reductase-related iron-sulfur binding cluster [Oryzobacter terrae]|uniref:heterodisulfide reductase-related iron-sulfur binding cluster n=1 Tax=Oryzobacter terrae TaxID=1620385 RepID=UPI0036714D0E